MPHSTLPSHGSETANSHSTASSDLAPANGAVTLNGHGTPDLEVDVLIIGAGGAGIMAATCAAAYGLKTRIIDKRATHIKAGHGDGIHGRLMEIMDTFGLASKIQEHGIPFSHTHNWRRNAEGVLERTGATVDPWLIPSPFTTITLTQSRTMEFMLGFIEQSSDIRVERSKMPESIQIATKKNIEYPVTVSVKSLAKLPSKLNGHRNDNDVQLDDTAAVFTQAVEDSTETIKAKYVIACDGAHSWTRKQFDILQVGEDSDLIWGVLDIVPITDFPSARVVNMIMTEDGGLMWIPRERNMIRIYTVMGAAQTDAGGKLVRSSMTAEKILHAAQKHLYPYKLEYMYCDWWAAYQVGQRVATDNFLHDRVLFAGDAVHTHSPQAGQGLNVSMCDTYNLMWKLNLVVKGLADPKLLNTYRDERHTLGQELVDFDRRWAALASGRAPPGVPQKTAAVEAERIKMSTKAGLVFHGLQVVYNPGLLTASSEAMVEGAKKYLDSGKLPPGIVVGMRMPSHAVRNHSSGTLTRIGETFVSNGRFKLIVFPGDIGKTRQMTRYKDLAVKINGFLRDFNPVADSIMAVVTLHSANPLEVRLLDLPEIYHPFNAETGWDYDKVFYDGHELDDSVKTAAYESYDVDAEEGLLVVVRPDGYVGYKGEIGAFNDVVKYFDGFMAY